MNELLTKDLNNIHQLEFCLFFNDFFEKIVGLYPMCNKDEIYFRITKPIILPSFIYWHLKQDFKMNVIPYSYIINSERYRYISIYDLGDHPIYFNGHGKLLKNLGVFVEKEKYCNISIGKNGKKFAKLRLVNNKPFDTEI